MTCKRAHSHSICVCVLVAASVTALMSVITPGALASNPPAFLPIVTYGSGGTYAYSVAVADVNGDGKADLLVASCGPGDTCGGGITGVVGVLLGNGDGTFKSAVTYDAAGSQTASVIVADVNGDGNADLLVANGNCINSGSCGRGAIGVLLGNGNGTFQSAVLYDSGGDGAHSVAVADVNGDGKPDLAVANFCASPIGNCGVGAAGIVGVLLGNGDGTFQPAVTYNSGGYWISDFIAVADVNGDGQPDLLVVNLEGEGVDPFEGSVGVLLNNTDTTPPVITLFATLKALWPPTGKMLPVTISGTITDTGSGVNSSSPAYSVTDEYGQVPTGAITLGAGGSYSFTVLLQASRLGSDLDGRHYTITISASDNAGNAASQATVITVPHDQGR